MKAYEDHLYEEWKAQVEAVLPGLLKRNLLVKPTDKILVDDNAAQNAEGKEEPGELESDSFITLSRFIVKFCLPFRYGSMC